MNLTHILKQPLVTEKTLGETKHNRYVFLVDVSATKPQIVAAVEETFGVTVTGVRTVTKQAVARRTGRKRILRSTSKTKKAYVELQSGQSITAFEVQG